MALAVWDLWISFQSEHLNLLCAWNHKTHVHVCVHMFMGGQGKYIKFLIASIASVGYAVCTDGLPQII